MKNLLLPVTVVFWYYATMILLLMVSTSMVLVFELSWIWIILVYGFIVGIISVLYQFSASICASVLSIYKFSWVSITLHSITGIVSTYRFMSVTLFAPIRNGENAFEYMWNVNWFKTLMVAPAIASVGVGIIIAMCIVPWFIKNEST
jgi:hypothetical protein